MSATFTDDDIEKTVENATGEVIGTVTAVEGDTARVEPRAGFVDSIRARLGWRRGGGDTVVIHESTIDEISSETIRLEAETEATGPPSVGAAGSTERETTEPTESEGAEPDRETHADEPGHPGSIDDADEPARRSGVEADTTAKRDSGGELLEEIGEVAKRDTAGGTDDTARETDSTDESNADGPMDGAVEHSTTVGTDEPEGRETTGVSGETEPDETAEGTAGSETRPSPDATSGTESAESPGSTGGAGVQDEPMGDTAGVSEDSPSETAETGGTESGDEPATEPRAESEEPDPADELDVGTDLESAVDTESDGSDADSGASAPAETDDVADEIDLGTDLESAAETESRPERTTDARPETELDPDIDVDPSAAADPRPETELNPDADGTPATAESPDPALEFDPGVDLEAAVDSDQRSETEVDPDAVAGPETDTESGTDAAARDVGPGDAAVTERGTAEATDERPTGDATAGSTDRGRERRRSSSPLTAVLAAQRTAMTQGQAMVQQSLAAQRRAARGAVEFPLFVQRQGLEAMQAAVRSYLDAVTAAMETGTGASRERRQLLDETITELEETHTRLEDEELADGLAAHLEELRALRSRFDERADAGSERAAHLLERQVELLEECQRRLDAAEK